MAILQNKPSEEFGIDLVKDLFANEIHEAFQKKDRVTYQEVYSFTNFQCKTSMYNDYFTTITVQCEYVTTEEAVLPNNNFLNPVLPLVPITIKSICFSSAYSNIT